METEADLGEVIGLAGPAKIGSILVGIVIKITDAVVVETIVADEEGHSMIEQVAVELHKTDSITTRRKIIRLRVNHDKKFAAMRKKKTGMTIWHPLKVQQSTMSAHPRPTRHPNR